MSKIKKTLIVCAVSAIAAIVGNEYHDLRSSQAGVELIGNKEGCVRNPYKCPADVWTVGIGSTAAGGLPIEQGKIYTDREIAERFAADLKIAERCVNRHFNGEKMNQNQFEAMTSIVLNLGCTGTKSYYHKGLQKRVPTTLYKLAQAGNFKAMCDRLLDFDKSGGKVIKGLQLRREAERQHCLGGKNAH